MSVRFGTRDFRGDEGMATIVRRAAIVFAATLTTISIAKNPAPVSAPEPAATQLQQELAIGEGATASRDQPGWRAPKVIVFSTIGPFDVDSPEYLARLHSAAGDAHIVVTRTLNELVEQAGGADAIFGTSDIICQDKVLEVAKRARYFGAYNAGVETCFGKPFFDRPGIVLTNVRAVAGPMMAEHAIALTFALARNLEVYFERQSRGQWGDPLRGVNIQSLSGKTMLVAGLGGIGIEVAKRAHAMGMTVIATRAGSREGPDYVSRVGLPEELPEMIGEADVVVAALPLVPSTTHLFDAKMFARMKKTAYFINVGRGGSVVTADLVSALNDGTIAGAGLDVVEPEPLPADHPLWKAKNVIITPHISPYSEIGHSARATIVREQLRRFVAGEKPVSVVDVRKGY
jgi:phosphoglycerate dehydrogenase-like enzyme